MNRFSPERRALVTSSTAAAFATLISRLTEPTGDGIFSLGSNTIPWGCRVSFFGAGADNNTFDARLIGWTRIGTDPMFTLWVPRILASFSVTMSAQVGIAGAVIINTDRFADTIVVHATVAPQANFTDLVSAAAAARGTVQIFSPANDVIAYADVPYGPCEKLQFDFDMTSATNGNAMFQHIMER